jgi:hypothetical protein
MAEEIFKPGGGDAGTENLLDRLRELIQSARQKRFGQ